MTTIQQAFSADHRACDETLASVEKGLMAKARVESDKAFARFRSQLEGHFNAEEQTLFPALEAAFAGGSGPVAVMRSEHSQVRELCDEVQGLINHAQFDRAAEAVDTLFSLLQSHNIKEEQVLYPMCDRFLQGHGEEIARALAQATPPSNPQ